MAQAGRKKIAAPLWLIESVNSRGAESQLLWGAESQLLLRRRGDALQQREQRAAL